MANHKVRNIILLCVAGHIVLSLSAIGLVLLSLHWPSRRVPTLKYYSNDANYVPATGLIKESTQDEEHYRLTFEWAHNESGSEISLSPLSPYDDTLVVWLPDPMKAAEMCNPLIGKEVSFFSAADTFEDTPYRILLSKYPTPDQKYLRTKTGSPPSFDMCLQC